MTAEIFVIDLRFGRTRGEGGRLHRSYFLRVVSYLISVGLGLVLIYSSYFHLKNPYAFLISITKYGLLDKISTSSIAIALPWWQLTVALLLITRQWPRFSGFATAFLFSAFAYAQYSALVRGLEIGCGCFGIVGEEKITAFTAARVGVLCGLAWLMWAIEMFRFTFRTTSTTLETFE